MSRLTGSGNCFGDKVPGTWVFLLEWIVLYHHWFHLLDVAFMAFCYGLRVDSSWCFVRCKLDIPAIFITSSERRVSSGAIRKNLNNASVWYWQSTFHLHCSVYVFQCMFDTDAAKRHLTLLDTELPLVELCPDVRITLFTSARYSGTICAYFNLLFAKKCWHKPSMDDKCKGQISSLVACMNSNNVRTISMYLSFTTNIGFSLCCSWNWVSFLL